MPFDAGTPAPLCALTASVRRLYDRRVDPSPRQLDLLRALAQCVEAYGQPPTYREICARLRRNGTTVRARLEACVRKGLIEWDRGSGRQRNIRLLPAAHAAIASSVQVPAPRQLAMLIAIASSLADEGCPPSYGELCAELSLRSKTTVREMLDALTRKGMIEWRRGSGRHRAIQILAAGRTAIALAAASAAPPPRR
jgi:SOS-response transcriptional repressor LexA